MNANAQGIEQDSEGHADGQGELSSPALLNVIWQRRWIVLGTVLFCLFAGLAYLFQATPIYTSTSRLYVEQKGPKIISESAGVMTESKNYLYTQGELLRSTPILGSALEKLNYRRMKTFEAVDNPVAFLKKNLDVSVGRKDDIISVAMDSPSNRESANVVNEIVESYSTFHAEKKQSTVVKVRKILRDAKAVHEKELRSKLEQMLQFKRDNGTLLFDSEKGNIVMEGLVRLSEEMTNAQLETLRVQADDETAKAIRGDPEKLRLLIDGQRNRGVYVPARTTGKTELSRLSVQLSEMRQQLTPDAPSLKAVEAKIADLKRQFSEEDRMLADAYLDVLQQRCHTARNTEVQLRNYLKKQKKQAEELNIKAAEFDMLEFDLQSTRRLSDTLDTRLRELDVTEDTGALNISILEVARVEEKPTKPRRARIMAMAMVLGLMLGVGLALLRDMMDQRLRSAEEISAILGTPVLGVVSHMVDATSSEDRGRKAHLEPRSNEAEAYRTVRTAVYFGVPDGEARTLLVTSPGEGEGKTTLTSNLAITMAQAGQRTLILDADFRRPRQHEIFQVNSESGLANVLAAKSSLDEVIQRTAVEALDVLPCGPIPPNPSEMLNSQPFTDTLKVLSRIYDHIIIDSPPVMPVTDARILGAMCDVTLLVLRAEKSTRKAAEQARDGLTSVGARILGVIVNDVPRRWGRYGYYSSYGYYGYGYGQERSKRRGRRTQSEPVGVGGE